MNVETRGMMCLSSNLLLAGGEVLRAQDAELRIVCPKPGFDSDVKRGLF